jgi:hypothetical protein
MHEDRLPLRTDRLGRPHLDQFSEGGFVDCVFRIARHRRTSLHHHLRLEAVFNKSAVGMNVRVVRRIRPGLGGRPLKILSSHVDGGGVEFRRRGVESDRLLQALARLYRVPVPKTMRALARFTALALHTGALDEEKMPVKLKLFGGEDEPGQNLANESFFNLDLRQRLVFWNEKDQAYRTALVRALAAT